MEQVRHSFAGGFHNSHHLLHHSSAGLAFLKKFFFAHDWHSEGNSPGPAASPHFADSWTRVRAPCHGCQFHGHQHRGTGPFLCGQDSPARNSAEQHERRRSCHGSQGPDSPLQQGHGTLLSRNGQIGWPPGGGGHACPTGTNRHRGPFERGKEQERYKPVRIHAPWPCHGPGFLGLFVKACQAGPSL